MALALVVSFLLVPIVEIYVIIQVGRAIGAWPTVALLIAESLLGAWLVKREGRRAWRALRAAVQTGRMPGRELADAGLVLVGGTLLLTPGFVTDVAGFFLVLPVTRPLARRALAALVARRTVVRIARFGARYQRGGRWSGGPVVPGEMVPPGGAGRQPGTGPSSGPDRAGPASDPRLDPESGHEDGSGQGPGRAAGG